MSGEIELDTLSISIHPLRGEWDNLILTSLTPLFYFNPPTPWGVGHKKFNLSRGKENISIHPLRGEWDDQRRCTGRLPQHFNPPTPWGVGLPSLTAHRPHITISIHPLRGEWDILADKQFPFPIQFQSTHSVGSGTRACYSSKRDGHFNPPTPWGVGLPEAIQTRRLRAFQSTHSVGSGTQCINDSRAESEISIHPLRGEWDSSGLFSTAITFNFNPPTPWGVGRRSKRMFVSVKVFQSTHSVGSGTVSFVGYTPISLISIHPLRGEWDVYFSNASLRILISIHPLRGEWDASVIPVRFEINISIHPLRGEWDLLWLIF